MSEKPSDETVCYRLGRKYLFIGVICTILFMVMGVWSVSAAYWNVDGSFPNPTLHALVYAVFWSAFTGLGLWIIVAYIRERLSVSTSGVTQQACVFRRQMQFADVRQVMWKGIPAAGRIQLRSDYSRITIHLGNFTTKERSALIETFRQVFTEDVQVGWSQFYEGLKPTGEISPEPSIGTAIVCGLLFLAFAATFIWCGLSGLGSHWFLVAAVCLSGAMLYAWRIRKQIKASNER